MSVLLRPRPYAQFSGSLLLLPLLPEQRPLKSLPIEIWAEIFAFALNYEGSPGSELSLLRVCKGFTDVTLPLIYSHVQISQMSALSKFHERLRSADQKWDSIRRIPYSTPGRWVQVLDLSCLAFIGQPQALLLDSLLTDLFPLMPFLVHFAMNPSFGLSRRALTSLADREGVKNIRTLEGFRYVRPSSFLSKEDPFVQLLRCCINLEAIEIIGQGLDPTEFSFDGTEDFSFTEPMKPLNLPKLHTMTLLSMHSSPLMLCLLSSQLPGLRKLTITPYDDIPYPASLASQLISAHGDGLRSLLLLTPKSWPTRLRPSPQNVLDTSPHLRHLSLENPLPALTITEATHPLKILSIPRPNNEFWRVLEKLLPQLPSLCILRTRDVRWLRKGSSSRAQEAGVQGEMREWRRRLIRRGIRVLDADWNENE